MAVKWKPDVKSSGELTVFNDAGVWKAAVETAMKTFNASGFGVKLVAGKDANTSNIEVRLSDGSSTFDFYSQTWPVNFDAAAPHGKTLPFVDPDNDVLIKAAVFLPRKLESMSDEVRVFVTVHEFIHAAGLHQNADHDDDSGAFYARFNIVNGKLLEILPNKGAKPMPPIRFGPKTVSKLRNLWKK